MEGNHIPILESYPLVSKVMPYYGFTHKGFLVLTILSKSVRQMIIVNYKTFRRIMLEYSFEKFITIEALTRLDLPTDLFRYKIDKTYLGEGGKNLVTFINKLINKEGKYFAELYMNEQICLDRICVFANDINFLYPHLSTLENIKIVDNSKSCKFEDNVFSLIDMILIDCPISSDENGNLSICYFKDNKSNEVNPIFSSFKRIAKIGCSNIDYAEKCLTLLKNSSIVEVETLNLDFLNITNFEETINPNNFNYKIHRLLYEFKNCSLLSDTVLMNIAQINPNELRLSTLSSTLNTIRILSTLPDNMNVIFGENSLSTFSFKFFNSVMLFKDGGKVLKLHCKEICFTPVDYKKESIMFLDSSTIFLSKFLSMKLVYFKQTPEDTSFEPETISYLDSNFDSFCLIKNTPKSEISLACFEFIELIANKDKKKYLAGISSMTKFIIKLCKMKDISNFSKVIKFAPNHTELEWKSETYSDDQTKLNKNFLKLISKFKLKSIEICGFEIGKQFMENSSIQSTIQHLTVKKIKSSEILSVLSICTKCKLLKTIDVVHNSRNNIDSIEGITDAKKEIAHCCDNIQRITINNEPKPSRQCSDADSDDSYQSD